MSEDCFVTTYHRNPDDPHFNKEQDTEDWDKLENALILANDEDFTISRIDVKLQSGEILRLEKVGLLWGVSIL